MEDVGQNVIEGATETASTFLQRVSTSSLPYAFALISIVAICMLFLYIMYKFTIKIHTQSTTELKSAYEFITTTQENTIRRQEDTIKRLERKIANLEQVRIP